MADISDPKIAEGQLFFFDPNDIPLTAIAYEKVRSDKEEMTWLLCDYESDKSNKVTLTATGTGDLAELASHLEPQRASFAYAKVKYNNDEHSFREKFILVVWIGEEVKVMRRAKVSVHLGDVKKVFKAYSIEVSAANKNDLKQDEIVQRLRRAGGANYDRSKFD